MWCPGRPFTATTTGSRAGWLAGNPAPFTLGVVHPRGGEPLMVGSHSVVPRCGAGGAPRLVGSHIAWGTTPRLASSDLALRTTWSSRSRRRPLSHRLAGSDRLTTTHDPAPWLPHQRWGLTRRGPLCTTEEGSRERPTDTTRAESARSLPFGSPSSSSHWGSPCGLPGCGAPQE